MKYIIIFTLSFFLFTKILAQKYDNNWLFGYGAIEINNDPSWGLSILDFSKDSLIPSYKHSLFNFYITNASMSDKDGKLLFYSNGIDIADASHKKMQGAPDPTMWDGLGQSLEQGCLILPYPSKPNQYLLFNTGWKWISTPTYQGVSGAWLNYFEIDMNRNNGLGAVMKNDTILKAYIDKGRITATKHANGRDWWLLAHGINTNEYYRYLVSPNGVELQSIQTVGTPVFKGVGQCVFSPDGSVYVQYNAVDKTQGVFLDIYDFDRCSGLLSNHRQLNYLPKPTAGGVSISPNSRFLYVSNRDYLDQYDLKANDIFATRTKVAEYDGFKPLEFSAATSFFMLQLAPNGKIYGCNTNSTKYLHIIHQPDSLGLACKVEQHGLLLPTLNAQSLPNFPNYRLGALKGSPCDTLQAVGVGEQRKDIQYKIYPNPAINSVFLYFNEGYDTPLDIEVYDLTGACIKKIQVESNSRFIEVNTHDLPNGTYVLRCSTFTNPSWVSKLVIIK